MQTKEHVNRSEPPDFTYDDGRNMGVVLRGKGGRGTSRFRTIPSRESAFQAGTGRPQPGDICLTQRSENGAYVTNTDHVFAIHRVVGSQCFEIAQGGTGTSSLEGMLGYVRFSNAGGRIRADASGRYLVGWLPLDRLTIGAPR